MFVYSILYLVFVQVTGMSPPPRVSLNPSGKFEAASVIRTLIFGLLRRVGCQLYHSLSGETKRGGSPFTAGCFRSSTVSVAGSGGQLLPTNTVPKKSENHGHAARFSVQPAIWKPIQPPPCSIYSSNALRCAGVEGNSSSHITTWYSFSTAGFMSSQFGVALKSKWSRFAISWKNGI